MKITEFTKAITEHEGKKKNLDIAQIGEVIRLVNEMTGGELYKIIRKMETKIEAKPISTKTNGKPSTKTNSKKA